VLNKVRRIDRNGISQKINLKSIKKKKNHPKKKKKRNSNTPKQRGDLPGKEEPLKGQGGGDLLKT